MRSTRIGPCGISLSIFASGARTTWLDVHHDLGGCDIYREHKIQYSSFYISLLLSGESLLSMPYLPNYCVVTVFLLCLLSGKVPSGACSLFYFILQLKLSAYSFHHFLYIIIINCFSVYIKRASQIVSKRSCTFAFWLQAEKCLKCFLNYFLFIPFFSSSSPLFFCLFSSFLFILFPDGLVS